MEAIGNQIRIGRATKQMTQSELAKRLGVKQGVVSSYERGVSIPPADKFCQIIQILGLNCEKLVCQVAESCFDQKLAN